MSADNYLPERPNLDQLRGQAKELRDAARAGEAAALDRLDAHCPGSDPSTLATAQVVVAREYGFAGWPRLKAEVEARTLDRGQRVQALLEASVRGSMQADVGVRNARAARLLADDPSLATHDVRTAVVLGEASHLRQLLASDPARAVHPDRESGWPPLLGVCMSRWHRIDPDRADGLLEVARLLMDAGASPNTAVGDSAPAGDCSALYAAAGLANHPALARLLLERGADPDTPGALYHAAFHDDHACLRLLLEHGATAEGGDALAAAISVGDAAAVRLLLDAGVDPRSLLADALGEDHPPVGSVYAAIEFGCAADLTELLLERGADPNGHGQGGRSPLRLAVRRGETDIAELLLRYGARDDATAIDRFLDACVRADRAETERVLARDPGMLGRLTDEDRGAIVHVAGQGSMPSVRLMLDLGFPIGARGGDDGGTALHAAAGAGSAELVRFLIERGADLEARDTTWNSTPVTWATVGSGLHPAPWLPNPDPDWVATVQALVDAGASLDGAWIDIKPPSPEVADLLRVYGIGGTTELY